MYKADASVLIKALNETVCEYQAEVLRSICVICVCSLNQRSSTLDHEGYPVYRNQTAAALGGHIISQGSVYSTVLCRLKSGTTTLSLGGRASTCKSSIDQGSIY